MIIKVQRESKFEKILRLLIAGVMVIGIFSYLYFHIVEQTLEDNEAFSNKVNAIQKEKKESIKLQRSILNEVEKIISLLGADNIEKINFDKKNIELFIYDKKLIDTLLVRYGDMIKVSKINNLWNIKIDMKKLLTLKREEALNKNS